MNPKTLSEKLMFNTVRLVANDGSSGTGFFYTFRVNGNSYPVIITNQHVINYNPQATMTFHLHLKADDGSPAGNYKVTYQTDWIFHPTKDLCFCFINPVFEYVKNTTGKNIYYVTNDESVIATKQKLEELSALEELVMVGYPIGLWDEKNNFPD